MSDAVAEKLAAASTGYLSKDDYKRKREEIEQEDALRKLREKMGSEGAAAEVTKKKSKKKDKRPSALSFGDELDAEADPSPRVVPKKMGKCQDVDVSFLKKNDREAQEAASKSEAALREYLVLQQKAKQEPVELPYVFRSEATQRELPQAVHRGTVTVIKGSTSEEVARLVRQDVAKTAGPKFALPEVAGRQVESDVVLAAGVAGNTIGSFIIPASLTLVQVLSQRWSEGSSMFEDFKCGIVVTERRWYEASRHVFPFSQWSVFDEHKTYSLKEFISNRNAKSGVDPVRTKS